MAKILWNNWMIMCDSLDEAKSSCPKPEWEDLRAYVEKESYDNLKKKYLELKKQFHYLKNQDGSPYKEDEHDL